MAEVAPAGAKEVDQRPNTHDPFWDSQQDILKTYSFNYEALTEYKQKLHRSGMCGWIIFPPALVCAVLFDPCDMANIRDEVNARHIALTADGLRYIVDKHPGGCRLACQDEGRSSQTDRSLRQDHRLRRGGAGRKRGLPVPAREAHGVHVQRRHGERPGVPFPYDLGPAGHQGLSIPSDARSARPREAGSAIKTYHRTARWRALQGIRIQVWNGRRARPQHHPRGQRRRPPGNYDGQGRYRDPVTSTMGITRERPVTFRRRDLSTMLSKRILRFTHPI